MVQGQGRGVSVTSRRPEAPTEGADASPVGAAGLGRAAPAACVPAPLAEATADWLEVGAGAGLGASAPAAAGATTGRSTLERISSLGPNACTRPSAIISTRSTLA